MLNKKQLKEKSIDVNQYPVIDNIDKMIALELEKIEKYKQLKQSLFVYRLTDEKIIYRLIFNDETFYFNEADGKKLLDSTYNYDIQKIDIAKLRLKNAIE